MPTVVATLPTLKMCKHPGCGNIATGYKGTCYEHSPRKDLNSYYARPKPTVRTKFPVGVEIECYNPTTVYKVTHVAQCVADDGSLPNNGGEIKLCGNEDKIEDKAADCVQRSALVGNKVNKQCGLHLHFQLPNASTLNYRSEQSNRLTTLVYNMEEFMYDIVPQSRKHNSYCGRVHSPTGYIHDHYKWFSLSSSVPTYEIRIHAGTMNPWKIKGWINAWKQVRPDIHKVINGESGWEDIAESYKGDGFMRKLDPDSIGYKYIQSRSTSGGTLRSFGF